MCAHYSGLRGKSKLFLITSSQRAKHKTKDPNPPTFPSPGGKTPPDCPSRKPAWEKDPYGGCWWAPVSGHGYQWAPGPLLWPNQTQVCIPWGSQEPCKVYRPERFHSFPDQLSNGLLLKPICPEWWAPVTEVSRPISLHHHPCPASHYWPGTTTPCHPRSRDTGLYKSFMHFC